MIPSTTLARYDQEAHGVLRIVTALLLISHAIVKLFGFPPGAEPGPQALTSLFGIAGLFEIVAGPLLLIGLFTRPVAFLAAVEMARLLVDPRPGEPLPDHQPRRGRDPVLLHLALSGVLRAGGVEGETGGVADEAQQALAGRRGHGRLVHFAGRPARGNICTRPERGRDLR